MSIHKQVLPLLLLVLALAGCATGSITNLTPSQYSRNGTGLYRVEAAMDSDQQTLQWSTVRPSVVIDTDFYPMRATPLMKNRWETVIPVTPGTNIVFYRIKFDYDYAGMGKQKPDSKLSPTYRLEIKDK